MITTTPQDAASCRHPGRHDDMKHPEESGKSGYFFSGENYIFSKESLAHPQKKTNLYLLLESWVEG